jgi:hypothetical protein
MLFDYFYLFQYTIEVLSVNIYKHKKEEMPHF